MGQGVSSPPPAYWMEAQRRFAEDSAAGIPWVCHRLGRQVHNYRSAWGMAKKRAADLLPSLVQKKALTIERKGLYLLVPRDRIELPTRGFSVLRHCVIFQELACGAHQITWCKPLFHTFLNTPPRPSGHLFPHHTKKPPISERPSTFRLTPRSAVPATASVRPLRPKVHLFGD